ncbi:MAG: DUF4974 domain-containing protein [Pirellulaceae bacterium]|jgi:hypothetical protein|nr:DUF4974 domain-containing protein [Pirellulaceae bacterium]MDP7017658.1 DUF4974 domain-containing protein [Pirellulaceae bacterium]
MEYALSDQYRDVITQNLRGVRLDVGMEIMTMRGGMGFEFDQGVLFAGKKSEAGLVRERAESRAERRRAYTPKARRVCAKAAKLKASEPRELKQLVADLNKSLDVKITIDADEELEVRKVALNISGPLDRVLDVLTAAAGADWRIVNDQIVISY